MKTSILAIFFLTTVVWAQNQADPNDPNNIEELKRQVTYLKRLNIAQVKKIGELETDNKQLTGRVRFLEQLCIKLGYTPAETNRKLINQIKTASKIIKDKFDRPLEVGQMARLGGNNVLKVIQIQDSNNMLAKLQFYGEREDTWSTDEIIWLKGISTSGLATNSKIDFRGILKITGTKSLKNVSIGYEDHTAFVFEPFNYDE